MTPGRLWLRDWFQHHEKALDFSALLKLVELSSHIVLTTCLRQAGYNTACTKMTCAKVNMENIQEQSHVNNLHSYFSQSLKNNNIPDFLLFSFPGLLYYYYFQIYFPDLSGKIHCHARLLSVDNECLVFFFLFFQGLFPSRYLLDNLKVFFHIDDSEKRIFE